jgi:hypothetical protein
MTLLRNKGVTKKLSLASQAAELLCFYQLNF